MARYLLQRQAVVPGLLDPHGWTRVEAPTPERAVEVLVYGCVRENPTGASFMAVWRVGEPTHSNGIPIQVHVYGIHVKPIGED